jgi:hypothetical protein
LLPLAVLPAMVIGSGGTFALVELAKRSGWPGLTGPLAVLAILLGIGPWILFPVVASRRIRRATENLFDPTTRANLLHLSGVKHWGWLSGPEFMRKVPAGGPEFELSEVREWTPRRGDDTGVAVKAPASRSTRLKRIVVAVIVVLGVALVVKESLRKSPDELLAAKYEAQFADLQQRLTRSIAKLPAAGSVKERAPVAPLEPKPDSTNTMFLSVDAINRDGQPASAVSSSEAWRPESDKDAKERFPDKRLSDDATDMVFRWRPGIDGAFQGVTNTLPRGYEDLLGMRYAVAVRFAEWTPPEHQEGLNLVGGAAQVEAFLIDLKTGEVRCSFAKEIVQSKGLISYSTHMVADATKQFSEDISAMVRSTMGQMVDTKFEDRTREHNPRWTYEPNSGRE